MKRTLLVIILSLAIGSAASAQVFVAADGGVRPDGSVNYVFPAGSPFQSRGSLYPMPHQYWINPLKGSTVEHAMPQSNALTPMLPEQRR